jgi:D-alanyl-D-alanine carboxypeptidase/D-alanyl-D-alanine-endopeptidase (penicillin-binding protein 4)
MVATLCGGSGLGVAAVAGVSQAAGSPAAVRGEDTVEAVPVAGPVLVPLFGGMLPSDQMKSGAGAPVASSSASADAQSGPTATSSGPSPISSGAPPTTSAPTSSALTSTAPTPAPSSASPSPATPADPGVGAPLDPDLVAAAVRPLLAGGALGPGRASARIVDVATGTVLYRAADEPTVPASTMKLVTAVSALDALGPEATLRTRTLILNPDAEVPRVVVVGAGDPSLRSTGSRVGGAGTSLTPASLQELADATARALAARGINRVRVGFDDSLFTGPGIHPTWASSFPPAGIVAPVSALQVDQGRRTPTSIGRVADPATAAAETFAAQLERTGLDVQGTPRRVMERPDSVALASVESPTIAVLVERTLATSDNDYAEALARVAAGAAGQPASFAGVAARADELLVGLGLDPAGSRFADGSGLSRSNALSPELLTDLLGVTSTRYGAVASGLPVGGATGSLRARFDTAATDAGSGLVRAKTGTLTGVVGLAGYVSRPDGRLLALAILDDSAPGGQFGARAAVDRAVAELVACDCTAQ